MTSQAVVEAAVMADILGAYRNARKKYSPMRGPHEGYAVILEEMDELWETVKRWQPVSMANSFNMNEVIAHSILADEHRVNMIEMRKECLHVATMAFAFLLEVAE